MSTEKIQPGMINPPIGGDGLPLTRTPDGRYIPRSENSPISYDQLNDITDFGKDTRKLLESDNINDLLPENKQINSHININSTPAAQSQSDFDVDTNNRSKIFNNQVWNIKVSFYNHGQLKYDLNPNAIRALVIEDDILFWPLRGYIIVDNRYEAFERSVDENGYYHIRGDSRDEIFVQIWPESKDKLPDNIWKLTTHSIVYDVEDLPHVNVGDKLKKLYFWDKNFQFLQEKVVQWSTTTGKRYISPEIVGPKAHATDDRRSMYTGEAIASLLESAGYEDLVNFDNWDWGAGKIDIPARADKSIWEMIQMIISHHISQGDINDICLLDWDRGLEKLNLVPIYKLFEKATIKGTNEYQPGELQLEHLFFTGTAADNTNDKTTGVASPWKAPIDFKTTTTYSKDIKISSGTILNYRFSQTSGLDNSKAFITRPVYFHDHKNKQFNVDVEENEINSIKEGFIKKNYIAKLLGNNYPVFVLNKTKKEEQSIAPAYIPPYDRKIRSVEGKGKILHASIFLNQCLSIRLFGSTHRLAGTFVGIDRLSETSDTDYDYALCGQYFVVNTKHIITQDGYVNDLTMVKIHAYDKLKNNEEVY